MNGTLKRTILPLHAFAGRVELLEAVDDQQLGLDACGRRADAVAEAEHDQRLRDRPDDLQALAGREPSAGPSRVPVWTFSRPSLFISSTAQRIAASRLGEPLSAIAERVAQLGQALPGEVRRDRLADQAAAGSR